MPGPVFLGPQPSDNPAGLELRLRTINGVPPNMQLEAIESNTQILITLTYRDNQITGVGSWRIYYLDANLIAASDLYKHMDIINKDDGSIEFVGFFSILAGKAKWVVDISNSGTVTHAAVSAAP